MTATTEARHSNMSHTVTLTSLVACVAAYAVYVFAKDTTFFVRDTLFQLPPQSVVSGMRISTMKSPLADDHSV